MGKVVDALAEALFRVALGVGAALAVGWVAMQMLKNVAASLVGGL